MVDFVLQVGPVGFQDFEVPESIKAGGAQAMAMRKYAGGVRTIDAMGPDDNPLKWSGVFDSPDAVQRCRQLDVLRRQGLAVNATWSAYAYLVVVRRFDWDFRRFYQITYAIELEVVQDLNNPPPQAPPTAESQMRNDAADAGTSSSAVPPVPPQKPSPPAAPGAEPIPTEGDGWRINNP